MSASWRQSRMRSTMPHSVSSSSSSPESRKTSVLSFASGWRSRGRGGLRGDERSGEDESIERFGSRLKGKWGPDVFPSKKEFTRDSGPKEKEELMDARGWREEDGEGRWGIGGMA
jgi:hypothetical protein